MPQQSFYYNPNLPVQEFNLDRARQILDEAGWVPWTGRDPRQGRRAAVLHQLDHLRRPPPRAGAAVPAADIRRDRRRDDHLEPAGGGDVGRLLGAIAVRLGHGGHHLSDRRETRTSPTASTRVRSLRKAAAARTTRNMSMQRSMPCSRKGLAPSIRKRGARSTTAYKNWSVTTCPSCRCTRTRRWRGTRKGFRGSCLTSTRAPNPGMPRPGIGRADIRRPPPGPFPARAAATTEHHPGTNGGPNAWLPAQSPLAEPRAAGDRLDHRLHHSEPHSGRPAGAVRARSRHDPGGYRSARGAAGAEPAAVDPVFRLGLAVLCRATGATPSATARRCWR